jgi:16S rRNA (uracil1498-N3)-methyltransferase
MSKHVIRLFVPDSLSSTKKISLSAEQSHYIHNVMRKKLGDTILVFNGSDGEFSAVLEHIDKKHAVLALETQTRTQEQEKGITLFFAPVKNASPAYIVQKATELGVGRIIPIITERTIVRSVKHDKLIANAIEAAEQCERLTVPTILPSIKLEQVFTTQIKKLYFACENEREGALLSQIKSTSISEEIGLIIGPEGGFTEQETKWLRSQPQVETCSLGPRILKADTAAIAAISLLML